MINKENWKENHTHISNEVIDNEKVLRVIKSGKINEYDENTYAKLVDSSFHNGIIEVKMLSRLLKEAPDFARGFIGIAYRINEDDTKFESFYVRPTNGRQCDDSVRKQHGCQYFSYPTYTFAYFREHGITKYENQVDIDLNEWISLKAVIEDEKAAFYLNDDLQPLLVVDQMIHDKSMRGNIGFFVDIGTEKNSFIHLKDILPKIDETKETQDENIKISDIIKPNQKLLVQIKKDSNEKKGARVSTHINLPSKYIVLMPNTEIITVSQKIESEEEQKRLVKLVKENLEQGNGAIIRTSAQGKEKEIIEDIKNIQNKWNKIIETGINPNQNNPKLLYKSEDIIDKMLMDMTDKEISIKRGKDIFNTYGINKQIEKIQNRKIWLKCGGFITIDKTEALTAIDVNTGKYTGNKSLRQTILRVNQEATIEIAKQLRLRDIGGIIIIDYIDMKNQEDREKVEELLKEELKKDRTKTQVEGFTKLDLMEMTRKHICSHKE